MDLLRERKWPSVILFGISIADSVITVSSTVGIHPKQIATLIFGGKSANFEVKRVIGETQFQVGPIGQGISVTSNPTQFNGGNLSIVDCDRNVIDMDASNRAVYAEEPTVALRVANVDYYGRYIDSVVGEDGLRRLAVDTDVVVDHIDVAIDWPKTPFIFNINAVTGIELSQVLPVGTQRFSVKVRDGAAALNVAMVAGQSNINFIKVARGAVFNSGQINMIASFSVYFRVDKASVIEIMAWTYP